MSAARRPWLVAAGLFAATITSTLYVGAGWALGHAPRSPSELLAGATFAGPLLAILVSHELGHWLTARAHGVRMPPPYFLPMPFGPFGTLGAVIDAPERYPSRRAMLDVALGGPVAGLAVALPVLAFGLAHSPVERLPSSGEVVLFTEGRSLLYLGVRRAIVGPIPDGSDVMLTPTALAGWVGLLLTMMNLAPVFPLDGGQVLRGLVGARYERVSKAVHRTLACVGVVVGAAVSCGAYRGDLGAALGQGLAASQWLVWAGLVTVVRFLAEPGAPGYDDERPPPAARRVLGACVLGLFPVLFMPWWMRIDGP